MISFVDPNVGYALLMGGVVLAVLALFVPGTGLLELGAFAALFAAGYMLINLPFNWWALVLMVVALAPLALAVRRRKGGWALLAGSIVGLFAGSIFVFRTASGGPAVHPLLALLLSSGSAGLIWLIARKTVDSFFLPPTHNPERVVGMLGEARTDLRPQGTVYVLGENWSAQSSEFIARGSAVRVIRRQGLMLDVEKLQTEE